MTLTGFVLAHKIGQHFNEIRKWQYNGICLFISHCGLNRDKCARAKRNWCCWGYNMCYCRFLFTLQLNLLCYYCCEMYIFLSSMNRMNLRRIQRDRTKRRPISRTNLKWIDPSDSTICWSKRKFLHILWQIRDQNHQTKSNQLVDRRKTKTSPMRQSEFWHDFVYLPFLLCIFEITNFIDGGLRFFLSNFIDF